MFTPFQKFISSAAKKYSFNKQLKAIEICHEYTRIARKILQPESEKYITPKSYENGALIVTVANSGWAQQLQMNKHKIQQSLNEKFGKKTVGKIKIELLA